MPFGNTADRLRALKGVFGTQAVSALGAAGTYYVALLQSGTPATVIGTEPTSAGNYARVALANADASYVFTAPGLDNAAEIRWPAATGLYSIVTALNQWAIYDNSSGGTLIAFGQLSPTITVTGAGDQPVIAAGALDLTMAA
jgi:hypothetical protein